MACSPDCPGWVLCRDGTVEACLDCGTSDEAAYELARTFLRAHGGVHHAADDECPGCPGYDVFDCRGSVNCEPMSVLRSEACGVYDNDADAVIAACRVYAAAGYPLADGYHGYPEQWKRS